MREIDPSVERIAGLLAARNRIDAEIGALIERPMTAGHLGEWLAARVFDIELEPSATAAGIDGHFRSGPLGGSSVNIKWYLKLEGLLDMTDPGPDVYLVLAGPRAVASSSRGQLRPWCVDAVYLFDGPVLLETQRARGVRTGTASSVPKALWDDAEVHPRARCPLLSLSTDQRRILERLSPDSLH